MEMKTVRSRPSRPKCAFCSKCGGHEVVFYRGAWLCPCVVLGGGVRTTEVDEEVAQIAARLVGLPYGERSAEFEKIKAGNPYLARIVVQAMREIMVRAVEFGGAAAKNGPNNAVTVNSGEPPAAVGAAAEDPFTPDVIMLDRAGTKCGQHGVELECPECRAASSDPPETTLNGVSVQGFCARHRQHLPCTSCQRREPRPPSGIMAKIVTLLSCVGVAAAGAWAADHTGAWAWFRSLF